MLLLLQIIHFSYFILVPVEAVVLVREHSNNWYKLWSYYIAKIITDLPLQVQYFFFVTSAFINIHVTYSCIYYLLIILDTVSDRFLNYCV